LAQENVPTLPWQWQSQSPDVNPIENLWALEHDHMVVLSHFLQGRFKKKFSTPKTRDELISNVFAIWNDMDSEIRNNLSNSIFDRLEQVLLCNGAPIN
jgi:hypothetical protein